MISSLSVVEARDVRKQLWFLTWVLVISLLNELLFLEATCEGVTETTGQTLVPPGEQLWK